MDAIDPTYEYAAPQWIDFNQPIADDDNADEFFDQGLAGEPPVATDVEFEAMNEGSEMTDMMVTEEHVEHIEKMVVTTSTTMQVEEQTSTHEAAALEEVAAEKPKRKPVNLLTSWGKPPTAPATKSSSSSSSSSVKTRSFRKTTTLGSKTTTSTAVTKSSASAAEAPKTRVRANSATRQARPVTSTSKVNAESVEKPVVRTRAGSLRRAGSTNKRPGTAPKRTGSTRRAAATPDNARRPPRPTSRPPSVTRPKTPEMLKRARTARTPQAKTSEQLEMEKIANLKKKAAMTRNRSRSSFRKLSNSTEYVPVRSNKPLTEPTPFDFKTDRIQRSHSMKLRNQDADPKPLEKELRSYKPTKPTTAQRTKPRPFKFAKEATSGHKAAEPFVPMAQQIQKFTSKTPERFRKRAAKDDHFQRSAQKHEPRSLTVPQSPQLQVAKRARSTPTMTSEQREEQYVKEHSNRFKATPVNQAVINSQGDYGVPRVGKRDLTVPMDIQFATESRGTRKPAPQDDVPTAKFVARSVPTTLYEPSTGGAAVEKRPLTVPESPAITKMAPRRVAVDSADTAVPAAAFKAQPMPNLEARFEPTLEHKATVPSPFEAASRSNPMQTRQQLIAERDAQEAAQRKFSAQPLPSDSPDTLPAVERKAATRPQPFRLPSHKIGEELKARFEDMVYAEAQQMQADRDFVAAPATVTVSKPFVPRRSAKPLTEIDEFSLNSDARSKDRAQFDTHVKQLTAQQEAERKQEEADRMAAEERELVALRKRLVHKAQPVPHLKPMLVKPSDKFLTDPISPMVGKRFTRSSMRA
eukprot:m.175596 g.175596  ORF g.175596 m.175596 type:complete len:806 (+) comp17922_c0_seq2:126-2543(+)